MRQGLGSPVADIPQHGTAHMGQLGSDLVLATGFQPKGQETPIAGGPDGSVVEDGPLGSGSPFGVDGDPARFPTFDPVDQGAPFLFRAALHRGKIDLFQSFFAKQDAQTGRRLGRARQEHKAGNRPIQPMHEAEENVSRLVIAFLDPPLGQVQEARIPCGIALNQESGRLINGEKMVVDIEHGPSPVNERHRLRGRGGQNIAGDGKTVRAAHRRTPCIGEERKILRAMVPQSLMKRTMAPSPQALAAILEESGLRPDAAQLQRLWTYHQWLRKHNEELNLTRIHNFENMVRKLYVDSLLPGMMVSLPSPLMDLGTGPGMPGIPLKIFHPDLELILAESRQNRARFLESVCEALGLDHVSVEGRRIGPHYDRPVKGVITRAVEPMAETLERVEGCLERGGRVLFLKGPHCDEELERAVRLFAGRYALVDDRPYVIPGTPHRRRLVVFVRESERPAVVRRAAEAGGRHKVIVSRENAEFKRLSRALTPKGIKKKGVCLVSGAKVVSDVLRSRSDLVQAWITVQGGPPPPPMAPELILWLELEKSLFDLLDVFGTGQPLLSARVPPCPPWSAEDGLEPGCTLFVPFQDPENVGAVLRTAAAFGVTAVVLLKEAAHPFHPKAIRASAGAVFRLRLRTGPSIRDLPPTLPLLALSQDGRPLDRVVFPASFGLLPGLEGLGLPENWRNKAAAIPMAPGTESLNAATATAVALYEWRRRTVSRDASFGPA